MIRIRVQRQDLSVQVRGHSMTAPAGEDIVCAAVSALCIHTANAITEIIGLEESQVDVLAQDGNFDLKVHKKRLTHRQIRDTQLIFQAFELSMQELACEYPNAVHYQEGGVWNGKNAITTIRQQKRSRKLQKRT